MNGAPEMRAPVERRAPRVPRIAAAPNLCGLGARHGAAARSTWSSLPQLPFLPDSIRPVNF